MSLLNQVLQDLEKRQADSSKQISNPNLLKQTKAVKQSTKKSALLIATLILCISGMAYAIYLFLPSKPSETITKIRPQEFIKKPLIAKTITPTISQEQGQQLPITAAPPAAVIQPPKKARIKKPNVKPATKTAKIKKPAMISTPHKAEYFFSKAKKNQNLLQQQALLNKTLALNSKHLNAHLLLANNLLRQGLTDSAITSLQNSLSIFPNNITFTNILAQLYLQTKQTKLALNTLLHINPANTQNETYLSLLAASYQQDNDAKNSVIIYQKLSHINPNKAEYWLGLALGLEKLKRPQQAKAAYQHALNKNSLQANVVSYIKQRIAQLN